MNKPQTTIEQTEIGAMLGSCKFYTVKFESTAVRQQLLDGKGKDEANAIIAEHKINGEFDFAGVTVDEIKSFLVSTTSVLKKYQNDLMEAKEKAILELASNTQLVSVRDMIDTTKIRISASPSFTKTAEKMQKDGKPDEEVIGELERLLANLKAKK